MSRVALAAALLVPVACEDPADSAECREWQEVVVPYVDASEELGIGGQAKAAALKSRPDDCPIPW